MCKRKKRYVVKKKDLPLFLRGSDKAPISSERPRQI